MSQKSKWNKESVTNLLLTRREAVEHAILVIYKNQTEDEKHSETVIQNNGKGFLPMHARRGTYYANYIMSGKHLTGKHLEIGRKMALKYTRQLLLAIKEKSANQHNS